MTDERRSEILDHLKDQHGLAQVTMAWVRNRYDTSWDKLSRPRADAIAAWLQSQGIIHQPAELPSRETERVLLYSQFSNIGIVMAAARGEGFFENKSEAALLMLQGYAASLAKQEANRVAEGAAVE
ncbi:hypothetical protein SAMN06272781_2612 [Streptomyces sp. 1222.2]|uniref:hypothetical protein n=1 Tax=Streptomyces sp. 1222.2 TaxID=1938833 RepID=UPI000BC744CC|nr:hypothetical protein [Streptomyces sp. 1222.2]SOD70162.1 hypothetical protein SAMN06272781_2612 [Streptomyces sp. 1222.2]